MIPRSAAAPVNSGSIDRRPLSSSMIGQFLVSFPRSVVCVTRTSSWGRWWGTPLGCGVDILQRRQAGNKRRRRLVSSIYLSIYLSISSVTLIMPLLLPTQQQQQQQQQQCYRTRATATTTLQHHPRRRFCLAWAHSWFAWNAVPDRF